MVSVTHTHTSDGLQAAVPMGANGLVRHESQPVGGQRGRPQV